MYSCLLITKLLIEKSSRLYIDFAFRRVYNLGERKGASPPACQSLQRLMLQALFLCAFTHKAFDFGFCFVKSFACFEYFKHHLQQLYELKISHLLFHLVLL